MIFKKIIKTKSNISFHKCTNILVCPVDVREMVSVRDDIKSLPILQEFVLFLIHKNLQIGLDSSLLIQRIRQSKFRIVIFPIVV